MPTYEISIRCDEAQEEYDSTTNAVEAEQIFYKFARQRTRIPSYVLCTLDGEIRMLYHIDDVYAANRWSISLDLVTGLHVRRRYIPSSEELLGRKGTSFGKRMQPIKAPLNIISQLNEIADRTGRTLNDVRLDAYRAYISSGDTILFDVVKEEPSNEAEGG
jgi:hypothetical protein